MARIASVSQAVMARALKAARKAGERVTAIKIDPDGSTFFYFGTDGDPVPVDTEHPNEWDEVLHNEA